MQYDMLKKLLEDENVASLTLYLLNGKVVKASEYDKYKSDESYLFVTKPNTSIVSLKYIVNVDIDSSINYGDNFGF